MCRKSVFFGVLMALSACSQGQTANSAEGSLSATNAALLNAKTLSLSFSLESLDGAPSYYSIDLAKPNRARIDTPTTLSVADGATITIYDKTRGIYYIQPETDAALYALFDAPELSLWQPFFDAKGVPDVKAVRRLGTKTRKNIEMTVLQAQLGDAQKTVSLYVDPVIGVYRQAEFESANDGPDATLVLDTKDLTLNGTQEAAAYDFIPPARVKEVTADQFNAEKWYTDLDSAQQAAQRTHKLILVDFYSLGSKTSVKMENDVYSKKDFLKLSSDFIFLRIDASQNTDMAKKYKIGMASLPIAVFLDKDLKEVSRAVGVTTLPVFISEAQAARKLAPEG